VLSIIVYGRNDDRGYGMHKRVALSLNAMAHVIDFGSCEILFVDYNTADHLPTLPELLSDTLTEVAKRRIRVLRVRPSQHGRFSHRSHLPVLEPVARNVALRRSHEGNGWVLNTNTDNIICPRRGATNLLPILEQLNQHHFYGAPRFELPERLWETMGRSDPGQVIADAMQWGRTARLNEVVYGVADILFDGPGDFQLATRQALFDADGFNEDMLLGWHVDYNLDRRLSMRLGQKQALVEQLFLYHCSHNRQATATHSSLRLENDMCRFVEALDRWDVPEQRSSWGLAEDEVEEVALEVSRSAIFSKVYGGVMVPLGEDQVLEAWYTPDSYGTLDVDSGHALAHLLDLLSTLPPLSEVGFVGVSAVFADAIQRGLKAFGRGQQLVVVSPFLPGSDPVLPVQSQVCNSCHALIFQFAIPPDCHSTGQAEVDGSALRLVESAYIEAVVEERAKPQKDRRLLVTIGAIHNRFQPLVEETLDYVPAPYSTRLRFGLVKMGAMRWQAAMDQLAVSNVEADCGYQMQVGKPADPAHLLELLHSAAGIEAPSRYTLLSLLARTRPAVAALDAKPELADGAIAIAERITAVVQQGATDTSKDPLLGLWRHPQGSGSPPISSSVPGLSTLGDPDHWDLVGWGDCAQAFHLLRNQRGDVRNGWNWERIQLLWSVAQCARSRGRSLSSMKVLLACEQSDPLVGLLIAAGVRVHLIDVRAVIDSVPAGRLELFHLGLFDRSGPAIMCMTPLEAEPVMIQSGQGLTALNGLLDVVILPHNAIFRKGLEALPAALGRLRQLLAPRGSVLISGETEVQDSPHAARPKLPDLQHGGIWERLLQAMALEPYPIRQWSLTSRLAAFTGGVAELDAGFPVFGLRRGASLVWPFVYAATALNREWSMDDVHDIALGIDTNILPRMMVTELAVRRNEGVQVLAAAGQGHAIFGPFFILPCGDYQVEVSISGNEVPPASFRIVAEVALGSHILIQVTLADMTSLLWTRTLKLPFSVSSMSNVDVEARFECRLWTNGEASFEIDRIELQRL
jgi:hypothetical protein